MVTYVESGRRVRGVFSCNTQSCRIGSDGRCLYCGPVFYRRDGPQSACAGRALRRVETGRAGTQVVDRQTTLIDYIRSLSCDLLVMSEQKDLCPERQPVKDSQPANGSL